LKFLGLAFIPTPDPSYTASKHGIVGFTRSMAQVSLTVVMEREMTENVSHKLSDQAAAS
jgi:hypothetical protein